MSLRNPDPDIFHPLEQHDESGYSAFAFDSPDSDDVLTLHVGTLDDGHDSWEFATVEAGWRCPTWNEMKFVKEAQTAIWDADWAGVHYYWEQRDGSDINLPTARWVVGFGDKPLVATEVGPGDHTQITSEAVRKAYDAFAQIGIPMAAWLSNGAGSWQNAEWVTHDIRV